MKNDFCKRANKPCRTKDEAVIRAAEKGMRAYQCEFCGTWHLTSKEKRFRIPERVSEEVDYG